MANKSTMNWDEAIQSYQANKGKYGSVEDPRLNKIKYWICSHRKLVIVAIILIITSIILVNTVFWYKCVDGVWYGFDMNTGKYAVCGADSQIENATIQTKVKNKSIKVIQSSAFKGKKSLKEVIIPEGICEIGSRAFEGCIGLTDVTIPNSVTYIGSYAFVGCNSIQSMTVPFVGDGKDNTSFDYLFGKHMNALNASESPESLRTIVITSGETIGGSAFGSITGLTSITIPDGVTSIGDMAFYGCENLTHISIPDSVTEMGYEMFRDCTKLKYNSFNNGLYLGNDENPYVALIKVDDTTITQFTINEKTKIIYDEAFKECRELTGITLPDGIVSIGEEAFYGCSDLTDITIPNSVISIKNCAFGFCTDLTDLVMPSSIMQLGEYAFDYCLFELNEYNNGLYLGNIENPYLILIEAKDKACPFFIINENTKIIYSRAFKDCTSLTNVAIPKNVVEIGFSAFENCANLNNITIPNRVSYISSETFRDCTSLTEITIPDNVTSIGGYVFYGCSSLSNITIPNSVTKIGDCSFSQCYSLNKIKFEGTKKEWKNINKYYIGGKISVKCTNGIIKNG